MTKRLEALLIIAAKATGRGVVGVNEARAKEFGVPVGRFVRKGYVIPGSQTKAPTTGYYCPRSNPLGVPAECIKLDDCEYGRARYTIATLSEYNTGHGSFAGRLEHMTHSEACAYLRGIADGVYEARR